MFLDLFFFGLFYSHYRFRWQSLVGLLGVLGFFILFFSLIYIFYLILSFYIKFILELYLSFFYLFSIGSSQSHNLTYIFGMLAHVGLSCFFFLSFVLPYLFGWNHSFVNFLCFDNYFFTGCHDFFFLNWSIHYSYLFILLFI